MFCALFLLITHVYGILYVQQNEYRFFDQLDGLWTFVMEVPNSEGVGFSMGWYLHDISKFPNATMMPVPSAYNDIGCDARLRDHVGWVWYQKKFISSTRDRPFRHFLRFSSVQYYAVVFLNDKMVGRHVGGHLPFEIEVSDIILFGGENRITVAVNNTMSPETIPPGEFIYMNVESGGMKQYPDGFFEQRLDFDFFNYAGILRSVYLTKKPEANILDIAIEAEADGSFAYEVSVDSFAQDETVSVTVRDSNGTNIFESEGARFSGRVSNVRLWWPRGMGSPELYSLEVRLLRQGNTVDIYRQQFGFRTISFTSDELFINGRKFYCRGFGMHEDFELHGRGFDQVVMTKDLNMVEWMNGNCYRTSHYPYSEERALEADRRGTAVITEVPAVGMAYFTKANQLLHAQMIREMIERDRNHPSTIMWSLSNEPLTSKKEARPYYNDLINLTRTLDRTRPVTIVYSSAFNTDQTADLVDIICINRYFGWYIDTGYLDVINGSWIYEIKNWKRTFNKTIIITEYGAEAIPGLNQQPGRSFTEQYQCELLEKTHEAFDVLRMENLIAGEMIWNFADFMTVHGITRAVGNHKGVLTRNRQTKMSAYVLKKRYEKLAAEEASSMSSPVSSRISMYKSSQMTETADSLNGPLTYRTEA